MQQIVSQEPEQLQPYEQQRMDNISRNKRKLFQMQYGTLPSAHGQQQLPLIAPEKKKHKKSGAADGSLPPQQDMQQQGEFGNASHDAVAAGALSQPASKRKQVRLQAPASTMGLLARSGQLKGAELTQKKKLKGATPASDPGETAMPAGNDGVGDSQADKDKGGWAETKASPVENRKDAAQPVSSMPKPQPCTDTATQPSGPWEPARRSSRDRRQQASSLLK